MLKRATTIVLSEKEQEELLQITRYRSEQQVVLRARIVLLVAQEFANAGIARELSVNIEERFHHRRRKRPHPAPHHSRFARAGCLGEKHVLFRFLPVPSCTKRSK